MLTEARTPATFKVFNIRSDAGLEPDPALSETLTPAKFRPHLRRFREHSRFCRIACTASLHLSVPAVPGPPLTPPSAI